MNPPSIPGRVFLDTSVVNFMIDYGEHIYNSLPIPEGMSERVARDIESFRNIHVTGQRASWQFAVSPFTFKEVISTQNLSRRYELKNWFFEIWQYWREIIEQQNDLPDFVEAERIRVELLASGILDVLEGIEDRILICDAVVYRCDCFCTRDWRTILKHRKTLEQLPIKFVTPSEWWGLIEPFAGLWS
jgi:hypothetical protein